MKHFPFAHKCIICIYIHNYTYYVYIYIIYIYHLSTNIYPMCYSYTCFPLDGLLNVFVLLCTILRALYRSPPTPVVGLFIYFIVISQSIWLQSVSDVSGMTRAYLCIIHDVTYAMLMLYAYLFF